MKPVRNLGKDELVYLRHYFIANSQVLQTRTCMEEDPVELQYDDAARDVYSRKVCVIYGFCCATHADKLLNLLFKYCFYFLQHSFVSQYFQCCRKLNQNSDHNSKHLYRIFVVLLLIFSLVLMCLLPKISFNHLICLRFSR